MSRIKGSLKLSSNIEGLVGAPLDARSIVPTKADLTANDNFDYSYVGMIVAVQSEGKAYILTAKPTTTLSNWTEIGSGGGDLSNYYTKAEVDEIVASVYKPAGGCAFLELPELSANVLGNVYNLTEEFTTDGRFVEGSGKTYPLGTNVVVVDVGESGTPSYKFDILPGFVDLSGYQLKMQVTSLPTAAAAEVGNIYQFVGTTGTYTNGYFYKCVREGDDPDYTYSWTQVNVQEAGGSGELSASLTCSKAAGGIKVGDTYAAGTGFETLWRDLLDPIAYPSLTAPSASLSATGAKLLEVGATLSTTITVNFNRGSISPAYGTSGYRAGAATAYALNGGDPQSSNTFAVTVDGQHTSYTATVNYEAGEQPKDSTGANYDSPLAAGSVNTAALNYEFVNALWANISSISTVEKQDLVSASAKIKAFSYPAATVSNPEVFDVPASWTITAVEVLNTLSNTWEDCSSEFTITDVLHDDAGGTSTNYKRYTCNLGYAMGARQVRIKWS